MRYPKRKIDVAKLKKLISYDPETGFFTRLVPSETGRVPAGFVYRPRGWDTYQHIKVGGVLYTAHRLAWAFMTGEQPDVVDHINGLRHDNAFKNLRNGTQADNTKNIKRHRRARGIKEEVIDPSFRD